MSRSQGHDAGKTEIRVRFGKTVFIGQTLFGLPHQYPIDVRRTPQRLAGRGQVPGTAARFRRNDVRHETPGQ